MRRPVLILSALAYALLLAGCGDKSTPAEGKEGGEAGEHAEGEKHAEGEADHAEGEGEAGGHADEVPSTTMPAQRAAANGIRTERVGPGTIADQHEVQGLLTPVEGSIAKVQARFPGPIRSLRANVGDTVRAGQPLATIESNLSLTTYTVTAPISGVVLARDASVGAVATEGFALYEIANLGDLW
ncbi:hypothetical protein U6L55_12250, partial [Cutibacterium acnes]